MEILEEWTTSGGGIERVLHAESDAVGKAVGILPNTSLPFQMFTDAAVGTQDKPGGISAVLTQVIDGVTRPIGYFSRRLRDSENKYNSFNAELLAIHAGLQHWRPLLVGRS